MRSILKQVVKFLLVPAVSHFDIDGMEWKISKGELQSLDSIFQAITRDRCLSHTDFEANNSSFLRNDERARYVRSGRFHPRTDEVANIRPVRWNSGEIGDIPDDIHYSASNLAGDFPRIGREAITLFKYSTVGSGGPIKAHFADWVIKLQSTA